MPDLRSNTVHVTVFVCRNQQSRQFVKCGVKDKVSRDMLEQTIPHTDLLSEAARFRSPREAAVTLGGSVYEQYDLLPLEVTLCLSDVVRSWKKMMELFDDKNKRGGPADQLLEQSPR